MPWIVIAFAVAIACVVLSIAYQQSTATNRAWEIVARQLGLQFRPASFLTSPRVQGTFQGCSVTIDTYRTGGKNSKTYTRFAVIFPKPLGLGLRITSEGFFSRIAKRFGAQDIEVGDESFDRAARVKGSHDPSVREFLNPARRLRILRCLKVYRSVEISDGGIHWSKPGVIRKVPELVAATEGFVRLAWHLTGEREEDQRLLEALILQDEGDAEQALLLLDATLKMHPVEPVGVEGPADMTDRIATEPVEEAWLAGELYELGGQTERAREAFQRAQSGSPQDEEISVWAHDANNPRSPISNTEQSPRDAELTDASTVSEVLFRDGVSTFECKRIFGECFRGRRIQWSGTLLKLEQNHSGFLFDQPGGMKATIKVDERRSPYFGTQDVLAIVHISVEMGETLRDRIGKWVSFTGTLFKVDGLMRNLFVEQGSPVVN